MTVVIVFMLVIIDLLVRVDLVVVLDAHNKDAVDENQREAVRPRNQLAVPLCTREKVSRIKQSVGGN